MPSKSQKPSDPMYPVKGYVVLEQSFGYNDENYTRENGGKPLKVFLDKTEAEEHKVKLTAKRIQELAKGEDIRGYLGYDQQIEDFSSKENPLMVKYDGVYDAISDIVGSSVYNDEGLELPSSLTLRQCERIARVLDQINFFYVVETEVVEPTINPVPKATVVDPSEVRAELDELPLTFTYQGSTYSVRQSIFEDGGVIVLPNGGLQLAVTEFIASTPPIIRSVQAVEIEDTKDLIIHKATKV